jgi:hypothetical protein
MVVVLCKSNGTDAWPEKLRKVEKVVEKVERVEKRSQV